MKKTTYANSHGLSNADNKSCAYDIAILCEYCMKSEVFRDIVKTDRYTGYIKERTYPSSQPGFLSKKGFKDEIFGKKYSLGSKVPSRRS